MVETDKKDQQQKESRAKANKKASLEVGKGKINLDLFQQFSLEVVIGIVVLVLLSAFIVYPSIMSIVQTQEEIANREDILQQLEMKNDSLMAAKKIYANMESELAELNYAFPNEPDFIEDFKIIERIGSDLTTEYYNFVLQNISLSQVPYEDVDYADPNANYTPQEMMFSIGVSADYAAISEFVRRLGDNLRNFTVTRVTFSSSEENKGTILEINLSLKTIYYGN